MIKQLEPCCYFVLFANRIVPPGFSESMIIPGTMYYLIWIDDYLLLIYSMYMRSLLCLQTADIHKYIYLFSDCYSIIHRVSDINKDKLAVTNVE